MNRTDLKRIPEQVWRRQQQILHRERHETPEERASKYKGITFFLVCVITTVAVPVVLVWIIRVLRDHVIIQVTRWPFEYASYHGVWVTYVNVHLESVSRACLANLNYWNETCICYSNNKKDWHTYSIETEDWRGPGPLIRLNVAINCSQLIGNGGYQVTADSDIRLAFVLPLFLCLVILFAVLLWMLCIRCRCVERIGGRALDSGSDTQPLISTHPPEPLALGTLTCRDVQRIQQHS